jgi:predicted ferric reductase
VDFFSVRTTILVEPGVKASVAHIRNSKFQEVRKMLWTIFVVLLVLWLLGLVSSYTMGGFIHILLVLALVVLVIQLITGRRAAL